MDLISVADFHLDTFAPHVNTAFACRSLETDAATTIELVSAEDRKSTPIQEQFSLLFRGPLDHRLNQGMHRLEHPILGAFDLFLVPVAQTEAGFEYEAFFNRLIKK